MGIKQKITKALNVQAAESFVEAIQDSGYYYVFASKHTPFSQEQDGGTDENPPTPIDTVSSVYSVYNEMLFGKRVESTQVSNMIKRYAWNSGTVYAMYDDNDPDLFSKQFYVVIQQDLNYNVYKCLNNNKGAASTQQPFLTASTIVEFPQDGYMWKYMFTIDQFNYRKFATADYVPVVPNPTVANDAIPGAIEIITVEDGGAGYNNFTIGTFPSPDSIAIGTSLKYGLDQNASITDYFYKNCLIKVTSGTSAGEYRLITDYSIIDGRKIITIDREFDPFLRPRAGDSYEIYPNVFVTDVTGTSTSNCVARAIVNTQQGYAVSKIEVLDPGTEYRFATAELRLANSVSVTANASLKPIISPQGGHGSNVNNELGANFVGIAASFTGNSEPLNASNDFRTIGVLKNPYFANVEVRIDSSTIVGAFVANEIVLRYRPLKLSSNASLLANSIVIDTGADFLDLIKGDDRVIISNGLTNIFANVASINSDTEFSIDKVPSFTGGNCDIYLVQSEYYARVSEFNTNSLTLTDVIPTTSAINPYLVGETSSATARISNNEINIFVNGRYSTDLFDSFNQLTTLVGSFTSTTRFQPDEGIIQDSTGGTALVHSYRDNPGAANDFLYVTTATNNLGLGVVTGVISNTYFTVRDKYNGDLVLDSGEILYLENISPIVRNARQTENIRLILEF